MILANKWFCSPQDPDMEPDILIAEFLAGYYGEIASPFVRLYMDTMHAAVDETNDVVVACCMGPPEGIHKKYLTNMALITSAQAFTDAATALAQHSDPKTAVYEARVARARMANLYTVLVKHQPTNPLHCTVVILSSIRIDFMGAFISGGGTSFAAWPQTCRWHGRWPR